MVKKCALQQLAVMVLICLFPLVSSAGADADREHGGLRRYGLDPTVSVVIRDLDNIMIVWHDQGYESEGDTKSGNTVIRGVMVVAGQKFSAFIIEDNPVMKANPARLMMYPRVVYNQGHYAVCWLEKEQSDPADNDWLILTKLYTWYGGPMRFPLMRSAAAECGETKIINPRMATRCSSRSCETGSSGPGCSFIRE